MGRFSVVACLLSSSFLFTIHNAAADDPCTRIDDPTTINHDRRCVRVTEEVDGDVVNNATVGRSDRDRPGFFIGGDGLITGRLINNGVIRGGDERRGALTLGRDADVEGGIFNNGTIVSTRGDAITIGYLDDWQPRRAHLTGDIVNAGLIDGRDNGIAARYGTMSGTLINEDDGVIEGGDIAVYIADSFTSWTGGIVNNGQILGDEAGIQIGSLSGTPHVVFAGGIVNNVGGEIVSEDGPSIAIGGLSFSGGLFNAGLITQHDLCGCSWVYEGVGVVFAARTVGGGFINDTTGVVEGERGPAVWITSRTETFADGIINRGLIDGANGGFRIEAGEFSGGLLNTSTGIINGGAGASVFIASDLFGGGVINAGTITQGASGDGGRIGVVFAGAQFAGGLTNAASSEIFGLDGPAVWVTADVANFGGGIVNRGVIEGANGALLIEAEAFAGGLFNDTEASILAHAGDAVFATSTWFGDFENKGSIEGAERGFAFAGPAFNGDVTNSGDIDGGTIGFFMNALTFDGAFLNSGAINGGASGVSMTLATATGSFTNSGAIHGGTTGVSLALGQASGAFTNSGTIDGATGTGVLIDVGQWGSSETPADIRNAEDGEISGGTTGFWIQALSVFGDFVNDGSILGGGSDTGLFIEAASWVGDIINNGAIEAPSNALHLVIDDLDGVVSNTGTVTASAANGAAVVLNVGNGVTFANEDGGVIFGDVQFLSAAADTFIGREGGVEGDVTGGAAHNDRIIVENGTQYFVDGVISDFLSFVVEDGGVAVMGGRSIGDVDGPGYGSANVGSLAVHSGGRLYLDDDTILHVGTFTQSADSELTYFLVAPDGAPVAGADYGRIDATGAVSLAGRLSVILDPSSFGGTLATEFTYPDIIRGASFSGEFDETAIEGSSYFFTLALTYGDTSLDLNVTRTPFDQVFCEQHVSQNSEDLGAAIEAAFLEGGFTPEQIALFDFLGQLEDVCEAYFDLGGAVLGDINAIVQESAGPWKSAVNDRLNSTGATSCVVAGPGACLTRFAQNEVGTQVMTDATVDPFAWLRTGVRPEGQMSFWGRLIGVQGDNRGKAGFGGSDFTVTGGIGGVDYVFSQRFIAGVAAQWTNTDVDFKHRGDTADVQSFEIGGYFSYGDVDFCINGNASIIFHDFDTYRFPFGETAHGAYDGTTLSAYLEAGKVFEFDLLRIEPTAALTYAGLDTDGYRETGSAEEKLLIVEEARHRSLRSMIGIRTAYPLEVLESGRKIVPELRVFWSHEYLDDQAIFRAALASLPDHPFRVRGQEFARDMLLAGAGLNVPLSAKAALYVDYDVALSRDQSIQSVSLGARMSW